MKRLFAINALIFVALAAHCAPLATENFVSNKIAAAISQIPPPDFSTNNTELVETIEAKAPSPGDYAAVSNAAVHAAITNALQDAALAGKASKSDATLTEKWTMAFSLTSAQKEAFSQTPGASDNNYALTISPSASVGSYRLYVGSYDAAVLIRYPSDSTNLILMAGDSRLGLQPDDLVATLSGYTLGLQTDKPLASAAEVDALRNDNAQTRQIVTTWEDFLDGSNVVISITNYISGTYSLDAAKMTIKELREGEYGEVYNSRDEILLHINDFSNSYVRVALNAIVDEVAARLASKADRDWGKYTSSGGDAPANTVYMTAPNTVFAGGLEYERAAVGEGTICVLTTRGAPVWTQGDEGTFKFHDDGGTNYFGFAKTDSYTIGANTDGISAQNQMVTVTYNITMSGRPCVWYKSSLSSGAWEQLNLPDGSPVAGASHAVTWEANPDPGTQVCYINVGNQPQGFFRATVEVAGEAKFMTNMPADLSGGIICPNTATGVNGAVKPSFNGSSVIWTWSAN